MKTTLLAIALSVASAAPALADIIEIEMLNKNEDGDRMIFSQELIRAEVGDIIRFVPTDKSHNAQSVKDALPEGQEPFRGRVNQAIEYEVTKTGLTAVVCLPHQAMGMVALVVVGDDLSNADDILNARVPGKGGDKLEALVEEAKSLITSDESSTDQSS
ncbi:plastocyanin/azurin family copper-binding protein [Ruegeria profundi]|uniref:plastocyanin/azurin family copper-binding protein n=1 Tax=Ruegeria profundi TaxID=1685378 RepID=UPI001CD795EF|nr:plastocyanin/azurin family copper-binding protein [Ruegeria profundi]MCA0929615.1 copper-binding protein [Ruegeria profundi]